jgi:hypothetical protein
MYDKCCFFVLLKKIMKNINFIVSICALFSASACTGNQVVEGGSRVPAPTAATKKPIYLDRQLDAATKKYFRRISGDPTTQSQWLDDPNQKTLWGSVTRHNYSKVQAWNADQSLIRIVNKTCTDVNCKPPYNLFLDGHGYGGTYKIKFAKDRPNRVHPDSEERWHPVYPDLIFYLDQRLENGEPVVFMGTWNVRTNATTEILQLRGYQNPQLGPYEGNLSQDGKYVAVVAEKLIPNQPQTQPVVFAVDLESRPALQLTEHDISSITKIDWASISAGGKYIVINGCMTAQKCDQTRVLDRDRKNFIWSEWPEYGRPSHYDLVVYNGEEYAVGVAKSGANGADNSDVNHLIRRQLNNGQVLALSKGIGKYDVPQHVSTRNIKRPGWAYFSGVKQAGAIQLDGSGEVEIWSTFQNNLDCEDVSEAQAVPSPNGEQLLWASSWDSKNNQCVISDYLTER